MVECSYSKTRASSRAMALPQALKIARQKMNIGMNQRASSKGASQKGGSSC